MRHPLHHQVAQIMPAISNVTKWTSLFEMFQTSDCVSTVSFSNANTLYALELEFAQQPAVEKTFAHFGRYFARTIRVTCKCSTGKRGAQFVDPKTNSRVGQTNQQH